MTKVIKGEFEKLETLNINDVLLTCDTSLENFHDEFNRLSRMDNDLFIYEVEVANIPCDLNGDDDSEQQMSHEANDDMGHYGFTGLEEMIELTDEESSDSDDDDDVAEVFRIDTNVFGFETPMCKAFNEFNYLLQIDPDLLTKDIEGFKTYKEYKDDWIYEWNKDVPWVHEKPWTDAGVWTEPTLVDSKLKEEALRNKAIMEGLINKDVESNDEGWKSWDDFENTNDDRNEWEYENEHEDDERHELCGNETHELPVYNIRRFEMIKYSFGQDEEFVAVKENEYEDWTSTSEDACQAYQKIFRMMDEGWMVTRTE
ncbi:hypothetical protein Tco_0676751 [Tanacetum coccineum]